MARRALDGYAVRPLGTGPDPPAVAAIRCLCPAGRMSRPLALITQRPVADTAPLVAGPGPGGVLGRRSANRRPAFVVAKRGRCLDIRGIGLEIGHPIPNLRLAGRNRHAQRCYAGCRNRGQRRSGYGRVAHRRLSRMLSVVSCRRDCLRQPLAGWQVAIADAGACSRLASFILCIPLEAACLRRWSSGQADRQAAQG